MITLENWMSKPVITVRPDDNALEAIRKMVSKNIGDVVVVDNKKMPVGILTERDVLRRVIIKDKDLKRIKVKDIMTASIKTASIDMSMLEVSRIMEKGGFRRIPIIKAGKLVGVITDKDLIRFMSI